MKDKKVIGVEVNTFKNFAERIKLKIAYERCFNIQGQIGNVKKRKCMGNDIECRNCKYSMHVNKLFES